MGDTDCVTGAEREGRDPGHGREAAESHGRARSRGCPNLCEHLLLLMSFGGICDPIGTPLALLPLLRASLRLSGSLQTPTSSRASPRRRDGTGSSRRGLSLMQSCSHVSRSPRPPPALPGRACRHGVGVQHWSPLWCLCVQPPPLPQLKFSSWTGLERERERPGREEEATRGLPGTRTPHPTPETYLIVRRCWGTMGPPCPMASSSFCNTSSILQGC